MAKPPFQFGLGSLFMAMNVVAAIVWITPTPLSFDTFMPAFLLSLPLLVLGAIACIVEWSHRNR